MLELSADSIKNMIIVLLLVLIAPFVINCFFAYPQTDDFMCSAIARDMGFFKSQYHWFMTWSGRFTSIALISSNPLVYNWSAGYKLFLVFCMFCLFFSVYTFFNGLTNCALSCREKLIITLSVLFAFFDQMDDVRSGLYWMSGVIPYQVAGALMLYFFALKLQINQNNKSNALFSKCAVLIIAFLLGGTNEIVLVLVLLISSLSTIVTYVLHKKVSPFQAASMIAVVSGSSVGIFAPGNFARLSVYHERMSLFSAVQNSFDITLTSVGVWITSPLTLMLMSMVLFIVVSNHEIKNTFRCYSILYSICTLFVLVFSCFFIPFWCTGKQPENRVLNMIYFLFLIGWTINLAIIFAHFGDYILHLVKKIPFKTGCFVAAIYMIVLFGLGTSNFMLVAKDLFSGASFRYSTEMRYRQTQLTGSDCNNCLLDDIPVTPSSLYFYFLGPNRDYWVNQYYAAYFGKKSVALIKHKLNQH